MILWEKKKKTLLVKVQGILKVQYNHIPQFIFFGYLQNPNKFLKKVVIFEQ